MSKTILAVLATAVSLCSPAAPVKAGSDPYLADIMMVGFSFCPRGWAEANGQILPINQNQSLYSLLGTQFGGDGRTTFALPDLRGRSPIGSGRGAGLPEYTIGQQGGTETEVMTTNDMANHNHPIIGVPTASLKATSSGPTSNSPTNNLIPTYPAGQNIYASSLGSPVPMHDGTVDLTINVSIANTGNNIEVNNMQPYQVIRYCIATQGLYPSRN